MTDSQRKLIDNIGTPKSLFPEGLVLKGGTLEGKDGLLIDGTLTTVQIKSVDGSLIHISATAVLEDCNVEGENVLLEGTFSGVINAAGDCEIGPSASVIGVVNVGGDLFKSKFADVRDMNVNTLKAELSANDHGMLRSVG